MAHCVICPDQRVPADKVFEGKPVHSWHLSSIVCRSAAPEEVPAEANGNPGGYVGKRVSLDKQKVAEMVASGMNDRQIAESLGCSPAGIAYVRKVLGLAKNDRRGGHVSKKPGKPRNSDGGPGVSLFQAKVHCGNSNGSVQIDLTHEVCDRFWAKLSLLRKAEILLQSF